MQLEHAKHVRKIYVVEWKEGVFTTVTTNDELVINPQNATQNMDIKNRWMRLLLFLGLLTPYELITLLDALLKSMVEKFEQLVFVDKTKLELLCPCKDIVVNSFDEEELESYLTSPSPG